MLERVSMRSLMSRAAAALICASLALAGSSAAAAAGRFGGFHGYYRGLYPYNLFGYPRYSYGGYYPYGLYQDDGPNCRFVWKRTTKRTAVQRGIWTCT
jgi:hypothetical protein